LLKKALFLTAFLENGNEIENRIRKLSKKRREAMLPSYQYFVF
jgi:hypothetical protein